MTANVQVACTHARPFTRRWRPLWMNDDMRLLGPRSAFVQEGKAMLHYALVFLIVAIIAAVLGFGGIAGAAAGIAKILFVVFLVLAIISFLRRAK